MRARSWIALTVATAFAVSTLSGIGKTSSDLICTDHPDYGLVLFDGDRLSSEREGVAPYLSPSEVRYFGDQGRADTYGMSEKFRQITSGLVDCVSPGAHETLQARYTAYEDLYSAALKR